MAPRASNPEITMETCSIGERMTTCGRRFGFVPRAVTPLRFSDFLAGVAGHVDGTGRAALRRAVASRLGARHTATYPSFRHAIYACLRGLASADPDGRSSVAMPAFACPDFHVAVERAGLDVVRYDLDPKTLAMDPDSVESAVTSETLALLAVNHLGYGNRMDVPRDLCDDHAVHLVEDLGYSLGTEFEGRPLGSFGDAAVLNFKEGKAIPVGGGMVTSNREWLDVSDEGRYPVPQNAPVLAGYKLFSPPIAYGVYRAATAILEELGALGGAVSTHAGGGNGVDLADPHPTMSPFQAGVGARVLDRLAAHRRYRARTAAFYEEQLGDLDGVTLVRPPPGVSTVQYIRFPILLEDAPLREAVRSALRAAGIDAATLYDELEIDPDEHPNSERVRRTILTLPTHPYVRPADRQLAVDVVAETVRAA